MPTGFKVLVGGLLALVVLGVVLVGTGVDASIVPVLTLLWLGLIVAHIVLIDSHKRWPHLNAWQRWTALITFDAKRQDLRAKYRQEQQKK